MTIKFPAARALLCAGLVAACALAGAPARAQSAPPAHQSRDVFEMQCSLFRHYADGSWSSAQPMTLQAAGGNIPLKPNFHFRPGVQFGGFDLAKALDGACLSQ